MIINFFLRFSTRFGQTLYVSGNHALLGEDQLAKAIPLQYFNDQWWQGKLELHADEYPAQPLEYRYILREESGNEVIEWGDDRLIDFKLNGNAKELVMIDTWNHAGETANAFFTQPFQEVLLKHKISGKAKLVKSSTHEFKVKAPLLQEGEVIFISGIGPELGDWNTSNPLLLSKSGNWWSIRLDLSSVTYPIAYKYGVYDTVSQQFKSFEGGINRTLPATGTKGKKFIIHDGFANLPFPGWKGAGVAIPVFSLRTQSGFGTGEFTDIRLLVDWAKQSCFKLIQLLPVNDTTATHSFTDSYPYAAISAFALHPLYLNLEKVAAKKGAALLKPLREKQLELNKLSTVDYEEVMRIKLDTIKALYEQQKEAFKENADYFEFFELNRHWLVPYAAFCYLRDKYKTADYSQWKTHSVFNEAAVQKLAAPSQKHYDSIALHYFIQYNLHLQLKDATAYAHKNGIIVKGDLPIGIYRYGCDAWMAPDLYNMDAQAGAPPDDFAITGQNWGFPTYNWKKMQEDGFAWWRQRFEQMSYYFDAFRIDHILGFFRIWSIPLHSVEGIMGHFVPALPVTPGDFYQNGMAFQYLRFCKPYTAEHIINEKFAADAGYAKDEFFEWKDGALELKPAFDTQRKVETYFAAQPQTPLNAFLKKGLFDIISNVILFEEEGSNRQRFHFRFNMEQTSSYRDLDEHTKYQLHQLYVDYFYRRQDDFWKKEAMHKLPELKRTTNMLVCGEDLGMVPACVPDVMQQLGILSLEIQRMPKDPKKEFFHPADAPYLSVVTPSTHDMSTIRGWWEEDHATTQHFYNAILGHYGAAPYFCEAWINKEIVVQHLYSPAMWSIFQMQDLLGIDPVLRRQDPAEERINIPADPKHYWRYRMHIPLEDLLNESAFNTDLKEFVTDSGR